MEREVGKVGGGGGGQGRRGGGRGGGDGSSRCSNDVLVNEVPFPRSFIFHEKKVFV